MDPSSSLTHGTEISQLRSDGFVDELLVQNILSGSAYQRLTPEPAHLAMSSSEDDFAGWNLPAKCSFLLPVKKSA